MLPLLQKNIYIYIYIYNAYGHTRHRASQPFVHQSCSPHCVCLGDLGNNIHVFCVISMRPVLCLPKHTSKGKKYRAERPPLFFPRAIVKGSCLVRLQPGPRRQGRQESDEDPTNRFVVKNKQKPAVFLGFSSLAQGPAPWAPQWPKGPQRTAKGSPRAPQREPKGGPR